MSDPNGVPPDDGIYGSILDTVYHADRESLSSSGARLLLPPSCPALFLANQQEPPKPKPQYDFGHAAHKMVLGEGSHLAMLDPAIHGKTKDGKVSEKPTATAGWREADAKARNQGKLPIAKADMQKAQVMAGKVFAHPLAERLLRAGTPELSGYWHDDATGERLRCRPDWITDPPAGGRLICVDYKTSTSANPRHFEKQAAEYGYHQQAAWYLEGLAALGISDDAAFAFIVQSKSPPYLVSVIQLVPQDLELGRRANRTAIDLYAKCRANQQWPGYGDGIHTCSLPMWAVTTQQAALDAI